MNTKKPAVFSHGRLGWTLYVSKEAFTRSAGGSEGEGSFCGS